MHGTQAQDGLLEVPTAPPKRVPRELAPISWMHDWSATDSGQFELAVPTVRRHSLPWLQAAERYPAIFSATGCPLPILCVEWGYCSTAF